MTKPSRFFENGFDAACGGSFWVDSADSSENRTSASGLTEPSVATHSAASASPRRIASTPSWIAVAPEAQAVESEIGEPLVPNVLGQMAGHRAEHEAVVISREPSAAADAQHVVIVEIGLADRASELQPLRPFDFDRRDREEQRSGKIAFAADARPASSASSVAISASRSVRPVEENGSTVTKSTVPAIVVFRPSIGKRVMVRMPDSPAVSFAQLSALPAPSDVTTPMPVTTTIGLPNLSRGAVMFPRRCV